MVSLFALIITLGIVVDDAIVVGEHADWRARRGEGPIEAAENAARRMALPVFAATLTTIIAFFGLLEKLKNDKKIEMSEVTNCKAFFLGNRLHEKYYYPIMNLIALVNFGIIDNGVKSYLP